MTRKLIESTFVTLDGVIGDPQVWGTALLGRRAHRLCQGPRRRG